MERTKEIKIAIDMGHENVVASYYNPITKRAECVSMRDGGYQCPAAVYIENNTHCVVGAPAKDRSILDPDKVAMHFKRDLGTEQKIKINQKYYSPEQMAALTLKEVMVNLERAYGKSVRDAAVWIMVPATFGVRAKEAVSRAAEIAGIRVERLVTEPEAALRSYMEAAKDEEKRNVAADEIDMVVDIGSSTSDFFVAERKGGSHIRPILKEGINLGGADITNSLTDYMKKKVNWPVKTEKKDDKKDEKEKRRCSQEEQMLVTAAETMKKRLSKQEEAQTVLTIAGKPVLVNVTREELEMCIRPLLNKLEDKLKTMQTDLEKNGIKKVDVLILTGGTTFITAIKNTAKKVFPEAEMREHDHYYAVAKGGSLLANTTEPFEIVGRSYGIRVLTRNGKYKINNVITAADTCPVERERVYETEADGQERVTLRVYSSGSTQPYIDESEAVFAGKCALLLPPDLKKGSLIKVKMKVDQNGLPAIEATEQTSGRSIKADFQFEKEVVYKPVEEQRREVEEFLKNLEN